MDYNEQLVEYVYQAKCKESEGSMDISIGKRLEHLVWVKKLKKKFKKENL